MTPTYPQSWVRCLGCGGTEVYGSPGHAAMLTDAKPPYSHAFVHEWCL